MNLKISPDHKPNLNPKPKRVHKPNPFPIPNYMPLAYDFSYGNQIAPFNRVHMTSYLSLIETICLSRTVHEI